MSKFLISFLEGYGSVIKIFAPPEQDDSENLRRDWIQVGNYLKHSIEVVEREVQEGVGEPTEETGKEGRE